MATRGNSNETTKTLIFNQNTGKNYFRQGEEGKFIGLVKLLSEENPLLAQHLMECKELGRSTGHITFLSNFFIDKVRLVARKLIIEKIVEEIKANGGKFGVEMDTTQDITSKEQCSVVVRYHDGQSTRERTVAFKECRSTTGESLYNLLEESLNEINLDVEDIAGFSFDGAQNMRSEEVGVNHFIKTKNPLSLYVWCVVHRLNICVTNACSTIQIKSALGLAEITATFIKRSYKRMNVWTDVAAEISDYPSNKKLKLIGQTRWTSKHDAINTIVKTEYHIFVVIKTLLLICNMDDIKPTVLSKACTLLN